MGKLELIFKHIYFLTTCSSQSSSISFLPIRIKNKLQSLRIIYRVGLHLQTSLCEVITNPYVWYTSCEDTQSTTENKLTILINIPTKTNAWTPQRSTRKFMVCTNVPIMLCSISIERFIGRWRLEEERNLHAQAISQLERWSNIPLILCIETKLTSRERRLPTWVTCNINICYTITILTEVVIVWINCTSHKVCIIFIEMRLISKVIRSICILDK